MISPQAWAELAHGDVMIFSGQSCGASAKGAANGLGVPSLGVERLRMGQRQGEVTLLPTRRDVPPHTTWNVRWAAAVSPDNALVVAQGTTNQRTTAESCYVARWNGKEWHEEGLPFTCSLEGLWGLPGAFWATDPNETLWLGRGERWDVVQWSTPNKQDDVAPGHGYIAQIVSDPSGATWLLHKQPRGSGLVSRLYRLRS
jgi:hypothetical protein